MRFLRSKNKNTLSDVELLEEYRRSGSRFVLEVLFDRYSHLSFAVCMKYLKDEEDSKDAVLHIFERMHGDLAKYKVQNFSHWLYVLTRNHCLKELRQRKTVSGMESLATLPDTSLTETDWDMTPALLEKLGDAIASLNEGQQTCIRKFYLEEKTYQEIADETGMDLRQVKSHLQNGKRNLRNLLSHHGNS